MCRFPAGTSQSDIEQACATTPFPTLSADRQFHLSHVSQIQTLMFYFSRSGDYHPSLP